MTMFIDGSKLIYHIERVAKWLAGELVPPIHVEISPSSGCNQRCILCCVDFKGHPKNLLSNEILQRLPHELHEEGVKSYLLAGEGEPLLNPNVPQFVTAAYQHGIDGAINSNASLLSPKVAQKILPYLTWARFTVQSSEIKTYSYIHQVDKKMYHKVIHNLQNAASLKSRENLSVTLGLQQILISENCKDIYETCRLAKEIGMDYFTIKRFCKHPLNTYDVPEDLYKRCLEQFEMCKKLNSDSFKVLIRWNQFKHQSGRQYTKCRGLPFITQLLSDGKLYPCCQFFGNTDMSYGSLHETTFTKVWSSPKAIFVRNFIQEHYDISQCMTYCRHHSTNIFLDQLMTPPEHINFV